MLIHNIYVLEQYNNIIGLIMVLIKIYCDKGMQLDKTPERKASALYGAWNNSFDQKPKDKA